MNYSTQMESTVNELTGVLSQYKNITPEKLKRVIISVLIARMNDSKDMIPQLAFGYGADCMYALSAALEKTGMDNKLAANALADIHDTLDKAFSFKATS